MGIIAPVSLHSQFLRLPGFYGTVQDCIVIPAVPASPGFLMTDNYENKPAFNSGSLLFDFQQL
jgi:hypothetical protein